MPNPICFYRGGFCPQADGAPSAVVHSQAGHTVVPVVVIWNATSLRKGKPPVELIAAYEDTIVVLNDLDIDVSYARIHEERQERLYQRHYGGADENAYLLALQFLLEKIDQRYKGNKILVADEQMDGGSTRARCLLMVEVSQSASCRSGLRPLQVP